MRRRETLDVFWKKNQYPVSVQVKSIKTVTQNQDWLIYGQKKR